MTFYTTMSLNVAAFLHCNGVQVVKVEKENGKAVFHFQRTEKVKTLIDIYLKDETLKRFVSSFREIKEMAVKA